MVASPHHIILLMGPTATGKTEVACALSNRVDAEIVSVDSAMVYRGLDIGTAKPSPALLERYPHHLIDVCDPAESYSAARFRADALAAIAGIHARGRSAILVGGTGLYFRVLEQGIATLPDADEGLRKAFAEVLERDGSAALHERLARVDPIGAARIHHNDPQRIVRALEVYTQSGRPMSALLEAHVAEPLPGSVHRFVLAPADRAWLHARIAARFAAMLEAGFVNEVAALRRRPDLSLACGAMRAVGYRAVWRYLDGEYDRSTLTQRGEAATRQLAKRQFTWFRRTPNAAWLDPQTFDSAAQIAVAIMRQTGVE